MAELFEVTSDNGMGMNVTGVKGDGQSIVDFGTQLSTLLTNFDEVITKLTNSAMTGYMSDQARLTYDDVKESLSQYATNLINTGNSVIESAERIDMASQQAGDSIFSA